jgi:hypothetical protein
MGTTTPRDLPTGRPRYRYTVRHFKIEDHGYHQCSGKVVAVLSSTYSHERKAWYITVLCRQDEIVPGYTPGEEFWEELPPATPYS